MGAALQGAPRGSAGTGLTVDFDPNNDLLQIFRVISGVKQADIQIIIFASTHIPIAPHSFHRTAAIHNRGIVKGLTAASKTTDLLVIGRNFSY